MISCLLIGFAAYRQIVYYPNASHGDMHRSGSGPCELGFSELYDAMNIEYTAHAYLPKYRNFRFPSELIYLLRRVRHEHLAHAER